MKSFLLLILAFSPLWASLQIQKTATLKKSDGSTQNESVTLFIDGNRAKMMSPTRPGAGLYFLDPSFFACVSQGEKGTCFKKAGNLVVSVLQMGLPLEGLARYTKFQIRKSAKTKDIAGMLCQIYETEYELSMNVGGLVTGHSRGRSEGCFSNVPRLAAAFSPFQSMRNTIDELATTDAAPGIRRLMEIGYPLELTDHNELETEILGKRTTEKILRTEVTRAVVDWKTEPGVFELPSGYAIVDISELSRSLGSLLNSLMPKGK